jgi:murein tripeptide amidase MpaA
MVVPYENIQWFKIVIVMGYLALLAGGFSSFRTTTRIATTASQWKATTLSNRLWWAHQQHRSKTVQCVSHGSATTGTGTIRGLNSILWYCRQQKPQQEQFQQSVFRRGSWGWSDSTFRLYSTSRISISDTYDGGNIEYVSQQQQQQTEQHGTTNNEEDTVIGCDRVVVSLKIKRDPYTELEGVSHMQYFSFRSMVVPPQRQQHLDTTEDRNTLLDNNNNEVVSVRYEIINAGDASYAGAWDGSTIFYSSSLDDPYSWKRKNNTFYNKDEGKLSWSHDYNNNYDDSTDKGGVYFAYFPPFSYARHLHLIERCSRYASSSLSVMSLGQTLKGREVECMKVGNGNRIGWIIHRQHPGEHMAEFYAEGLLTRLLGLDTKGDTDGLVRQLIDMYTLYIVPSMNPDGAIAGYLRTNAGGANLNREWCDSEDYSAPSMERSPEVYHVLETMKETGCDIFLDIHGDEELPYNFLAQPTIPAWGPRLQALHGAFLAAYCRSNPDMQQSIAYEPKQYREGSTVLNVATDQVAHRFDCLSVTLEMPFKDCWSNPDPTRGWSPARSQALGATLLDALHYIHPYLRREADRDGSYWNDLTERDVYVLPTSGTPKY